MSRQELEEQTRRALESLGQRHTETPRPLPEQFASQFSQLLERVQHWGRVHGLTARLEPAALVDVYLADAWMLAQSTEPGLGHWLDVGSGGGAPGLVVALLLPTAKMTLVEPRRKRVAFLRTIVGEMALSERVEVLPCRSSSLPDRCCDVAISRATLAPRAWLSEGCRLAQKRVWVHLSALPEEPWYQAGWALSRMQHYCWPLAQKARVLVAYEPSSESSFL